MVADESTRRLLEELATRLEGDQKALAVEPLLRRAARIAALLDLSVYQALFQMHLDGMDLKHGFRHVHAPKEEGLVQTARDAFIDDRTAADGRIATHAAAMIDELHGRMLAHKETPEGVRTGAIDSEFQMRLTLQRIRNRIGLFVIDAERRLRDSSTSRTSLTTPRRIFVGHGHAPPWKDLRDFLHDRLRLEVADFDREPTAGMTVTERLETMLEEACFAFLVMTGEDEQLDGAIRARQNVIHEIGLCQGRLGRKRAIILLEDGCEDFSNAAGLIQIRFPRGSLLTKAEQIRHTLERERIILPTAG
jgi:predicted nucleotide-binding protein